MTQVAAVFDTRALRCVLAVAEDGAVHGSMTAKTDQAWRYS